MKFETCFVVSLEYDLFLYIHFLIIIIIIVISYNVKIYSMNNNGENSQMSTKSISIENNNKESVDRYKEKAKSFTDKIVNKISHIDDIRKNEVAEDKSSNIRFITFGLFTLIGFIVLIYAILVAVVADTAIQSANVFFVVTILSISILAGTLVYKIGLSK
jgi:hypothetical protein